MDLVASVGANIYRGYDLETVFENLSKIGARYVDIDFIKTVTGFGKKSELTHLTEEDLERAEEKDRLEYVRSIRFMLGALQRSILGWMQWINNPDIMTRFTQEELSEMNKKIAEFTRAFIEYDLEITKKGAEKGLEAARRARGRARGREIIYI